nr:unnamed protein product [Digitaria exilis]
MMGIRRQKQWNAVAVLGVACAAAAVVTVAAAADGQNTTLTGVVAPAPEKMAAAAAQHQGDGKAYHHVWPPMKFGWRIVLGSLIGFFGAACGSVGGVGGGGIFVPMLALIIGFDPKSSTAISKCMIMGGSVSTVYYNLKLKHPTLDMPIIDYDLALLMQPMLMLGVSIGVLFNVIFPNWLITALLIILFLEFEFITTKYMNYVASCSGWYWVLNSLQVPVAVGVTMFEAHGLMTGKRVLSSKGSQQQSKLRVGQALVYSLFGILAGIIGGLLGMGGGFIMGPLFLELGIHPQVSSATATFTMMFSSSMSVVEYYLLHRFPVPYASYLTAVAFVAAIVGQHCVRKLIAWLGRASLVIFILASMIFVSALTLGGVGISNIVQKMQQHQYMGFESLCKV